MDKYCESTAWLFDLRRDILEAKGEVAEWLIAQVSKTCMAAMSSRVRTPPSPPSPRRSFDFIETKAGFGLATARRCPPMYYVYILKCKDDKTYLGCCDDLKERIGRHEKGNVPATKDRLPVKLITYFAFSNKYNAFNFEKYLKSGSGRAFMKRHFF